MINAVFFRKNGRLSGFDISGHAGYADSGADIVCASVSSAAQLTVNTVTDYFKSNAEVRLTQNRLYMMLSDECPSAVQLISSLFEHLGFVSEEFPDTMKITISEV